MDRFSSMTVDEIGGWLTEQEIATSVVESFKGTLEIYSEVYMWLII